jgi:large subunit ribosomal protein L22
MAEVRTTTKYLRISPQKLRLVCDEVRGMDANMAQATLRFMPQKGATMLLKTLKSAVANAENNLELNPADLFIAEVYADEGPRRQWRRFGARGRFKPLIKRSSHLTVVLRTKEAESETVAASDMENEE